MSNPATNMATNMGYNMAFNIAGMPGNDGGSGIDPNAWTDEQGIAMTDELGNAIIFTP